jgi:hypothetical protein
VLEVFAQIELTALQLSQNALMVNANVKLVLLPGKEIASILMSVKSVP